MKKCKHNWMQRLRTTDTSHVDGWYCTKCLLIIDEDFHKSSLDSEILKEKSEYLDNTD